MLSQACNDPLFMVSQMIHGDKRNRAFFQVDISLNQMIQDIPLLCGIPDLS